jgi:transcriptional regulator with XRE-family HTH domain
MQIDRRTTNRAVLEELGRRIEQVRLSRNLSRATVGNEAGVSPFTVTRLEHGEPVSTENLVRVLRPLGLIDRLNTLVPENATSPIDELALGGRRRRRGRG